MKRKNWLLLLGLGVFAVGAIIAWLKLPLWRDTILHTDRDAALVMASGEEYPTNRWFSRTDKFEFSRLLVQEDGGKKTTNYIIQNHDADAKARLRIDGIEYFAIFVNSSGGSATDVVEYWIRPGAKID